MTVLDARSIQGSTLSTVRLARSADVAGAESLGGLLSMDNAMALLRVGSKGRVTLAGRMPRLAYAESSSWPMHASMVDDILGGRRGSESIRQRPVELKAVWRRR